MKRLLLGVLVIGCGTSVPPQDGGLDGAASDGTTSDAASGSDASDAANVPDAPGPDGGLEAGADCDPNSNQCANGLLCCSEPNHFDGGSSYFCEKPVHPGGCPLFP